MKNIIKSLLLILTLTTSSIVPHGNGGWGWGGFLAGTAIGTTATLAATSGRRDRSPEYYEYRREARTRSEIRQQIREEERQLRKAERNLSRAENNGNSDTIKELKEEIKLRKQTISDLQADLRDLR